MKPASFGTVAQPASISTANENGIAFTGSSSQSRNTGNNGQNEKFRRVISIRLSARSAGSKVSARFPKGLNCRFRAKEKVAGNDWIDQVPQARKRLQNDRAVAKDVEKPPSQSREFPDNVDKNGPIRAFVGRDIDRRDAGSRPKPAMNSMKPPSHGRSS